MARRAHLALNPPYFLGGVWFLSLLLIDKKTVFHPKKGIFCLFLVFLFLSPFAFFGLPLFHFLFLCLSVVLFFLPSFLSFFFACFLFLVFVSFFPFLSSLLLFHEKNNIKIFNCNLFFSWNIISFFWFSVLFSVWNPFFLSLLFPDFKLCFLFNINVFSSKKNQIEKHKCLVKKGVATKRFFMNLCFCKMWKVIVFFCPKSLRKTNCVQFLAPNQKPPFWEPLLRTLLRTPLPAKFRTLLRTLLSLVAWFARIGNSSDSCESAWRAIKIGASIAHASRESIRANRVANRPCH